MIKKQNEHNPVMTQRYGADPYALVYNDTVYLYMTADTYMYFSDGTIRENNYSNINTINVISSKDLVNWTDHGSVHAAGPAGAAPWGGNSWAPAAAYKNIDGKDKFFLYFANSGNGIAVLTSDSPVGPFVDPINGPLVSRQTPNCADVTWLFDPAVLMDDDGNAYIYFGGGCSREQKVDNPGTARVAKLGQDMISLDGDPIRIENVSYLFEDSGINKINGKYVYSYCSNFSVPQEKEAELGFGNGEIITMTSDDPMGPFTFNRSILKNPQFYFGRGGNNHHCMFEFKGQLYMSYHTRILEEALDVNAGYRSTNIDKVVLGADGNIEMIQGTRTGVEQVVPFDPYEKVKAVTFAWMEGADTVAYGETSQKCGSGDMILTKITSGAFTGLAGVDFADKNAKEIVMAVRGKEKEACAVSVRIDSLDGEKIANVKLANLTADFSEVSAALTKEVSGVHDLFFVFEGEGYEVNYWMFK